MYDDKTGSISQVDKVPETSRGVIVYGEFTSPPPPSLPGTRKLKSVLQKYEADPNRAALLAEARRQFGKTVANGGSESLRSLRLQAGLSQDQLAVKCATAQSHIAKIELGQTDPGTDTIARIAESIGQPAERVFAAVRAQRSKRNV
jgi:DNA-binding XRE family transcriptional regulator